MATAINDSNALPTPASLWSPKTILQFLIVNLGLFFQSTVIVFTQLFSIFIRPFSFKIYQKYIAYTMRMWSQNLIAIVQFCAPANLVMTFDENCGDLEGIIKKDNGGIVTGLKFPSRMIVTANHQIYADWIYIWCVAYLTGAHGYMKILLKASLKNLPVWGW